MTLARASFVSAMLFGASLAHAFPAEDDTSPGTLATQWRRQNNFWARFDAGVVDAKVHSTPPDSTKLDRRADSLVIIGGDVLMGPRFGLRLNVKAETSKRRQSEQEGPRADVEMTSTAYSPSLDFSFVTDKGLEIFIGVLAYVTPATTETVKTALTESKTEYESATAVARRFGVVRRGGPWSGGFYYQQGGEEDRPFEKSASDGSLIEGNDVIFVPSRLGVFGEIGSGPIYDFELAFVQARGMGPRDEDSGITVYTDYFEAKAGMFYDLGGTGIKGGVFHKTLSYARNAFVSMDTIPITSMRLLYVLGTAQSNVHAGIIGAYGKDKQSLPEFNAEYQLNAYAFTLGAITPF